MADTIYQCDDGVQDMLNTYLGLSGAARYNLLQSAKIRLFTAPTSVSHATVIGSMTEVTTGQAPGYAAQNLSSSGFGATSLASHVASSTAASTYNFICTGGGTGASCYGGYITDSSNTYLLYVWLFTGGPYSLLNNGDEIKMQPTLSNQSLN